MNKQDKKELLDGIKSERKPKTIKQILPLVKEKVEKKAERIKSLDSLQKLPKTQRIKKK